VHSTLSRPTCYTEVVKRKRTLIPGAQEAPIIPEALIEEAKRAIELDRIKVSARCVVCGGECAPTSTEGLCWVCRRLKLSAWRDSDSQIPAQE
jgi:hypothetical protein